MRLPITITNHRSPTSIYELLGFWFHGECSRAKKDVFPSFGVAVNESKVFSSVLTSSNSPIQKVQETKLDTTLRFYFSVNEYF